MERISYPTRPLAPWADWPREQCRTFMAATGLQYDPTQSLEDLRRRCQNVANGHNY